MFILHISDMHLDKISHGSNQALRDSFYQEYLDGLIKKINNSKKKISYIFITGDIVSFYKTQNYKFAQKIIDFIAEKLSIEKKNIFITNGNHDIQQKDGNKKYFEELVSAYNIDKSKIADGERFILYKINENDAVLSLDSIGSNYQAGTPAPLTSCEYDKIVKTVRESNIDNIFILSHHPGKIYEAHSQGPFDEGDSGWQTKHIWLSGPHLFDRLANSTTINEKAFWFSGDIHRPEYVVINQSQIVCVIGSINTSEDSDSKLNPEVCIIDTENHSKPSFFKYNFTGHNGKGLCGYWSLSSSPKRVSTYTKGVDNNSVPDTNDQKNQTSTLEILCETTEDKLYKEIIDKKLYQFGRFDTNEIYTSLSWVCIQDLIEEYSFFSNIIEIFASKIKTIIYEGSYDLKDYLIVGVDSWGSILSSRLGLATNIKSCCIASKRQRDSYDDFETINEKLKIIIEKKKVIFVISDVISTGKTLNTIYKDLYTKDNEAWFNFSIICDPTQNRFHNLKDYKSSFTLCGKIKMPIVKRDSLPSHDILRPNISFLTQNC